MAREKGNIIPKQKVDGGNFFARYYNNKGDRVFGSLKTKDEKNALIIASNLDALMLMHEPDPNHSDLNHIHPIAFHCFFGVTRKPMTAMEKPKAVQTTALMDDKFKAYKLQMEYELAHARSEVEKANDQIKELVMQAMEDARLKTTIDAKNAKLALEMPDLKTLVEDYRNTQINNGVHDIQINMKTVERLNVYTLFTPINLLSIKKIENYLESFVKLKDFSKVTDPDELMHKKNMRWNNELKRLNRFLNWVEDLYKVPNPTTRNTKRKVKKTHKGYVTLTEMLAILENIKNRKPNDPNYCSDNPAYWHAFVACLFLTGLSAHELKGLTVGDFYEKTDNETGETYYVFNIEDTALRTLKTDSRARSVRIRSAMLLEILTDYLKTDYCGNKESDLLFPEVSANNKEQNKMWTTDFLSKHLNGETCKGKNRKPIFPKGLVKVPLNCLTTRRTYATLMVKHGKSSKAQNAKDMGNSERMQEQHYDGSSGNEDDTSFV